MKCIYSFKLFSSIIAILCLNNFAVGQFYIPLQLTRIADGRIGTSTAWSVNGWVDHDGTMQRYEFPLNSYGSNENSVVSETCFNRTLTTPPALSELEGSGDAGAVLENNVGDEFENAIGSSQSRSRAYYKNAWGNSFSHQVGCQSVCGARYRVKNPVVGDPLKIHGMVKVGFNCHGEWNTTRQGTAQVRGPGIEQFDCQYYCGSYSYTLRFWDGNNWFNEFDQDVVGTNWTSSNRAIFVEVPSELEQLDVTANSITGLGVAQSDHVGTKDASVDSQAEFRYWVLGYRQLVQSPNSKGKRPFLPLLCLRSPLRSPAGLTN